MHPDNTLLGQIKNRVLTLSGNIASIRVDGGYLVISDGPTPKVGNSGGTMYTLRLPRAAFPIDRIVATKNSGNITLAALKWLHDLGVGFTQLDWDGTVVFASARRGIDLPAIRRAQIAASADFHDPASMRRSSELGTAIMRELIRSKIAGQGEVMSRWLPSVLAVGSPPLPFPSDNASRSEMLRTEATAAIAYWKAWKELPLRFARSSTIPDHWRAFGSRQSPLTGSPQRAITPTNTILNFLYGVAAAEMTIALTAAGLDPSFAIFHNDRGNRASLSFDTIEAVRPCVDAWLAGFVQSAVFAKKDFYEMKDGTVRITNPLKSHLAMTETLWRKPAEKVAGWLVGCLSTGRVKHLDLKPDEFRNTIIPRCCLECGRALAERQKRFCSKPCLFCFNRSETGSAAPALSAYRGTSHDLSHSNTANDKRRSANVRTAVARDEWKQKVCLSRLQLAEIRSWYLETVVPRIVAVSPNKIRSATGLSDRYIVLIRRSIFPHPMHFPALAGVVGVGMLDRFPRL